MSRKFTCQEIAKIKSLFTNADRREQTILALGKSLATARHAELNAARQYADSLSDDAASFVEQAIAECKKIEARIQALRLASDSTEDADLEYLARIAKEQIIASDAVKTLFIDGYEAKAKEAEGQIKHAKKSLASKIGDFLAKAKTANEAADKASKYSAEGQFHNAISAIAEGCRYTAREIQTGRTNPSANLLAALEEPLPAITDFSDIAH